jgi:hypothetical protein
MRKRQGWQHVSVNKILLYKKEEFMDNKGHPDKPDRPFFGERLVIANIGIRPFYDDMKKQKITVFQIDWEPPAGGERELVDILDKLL